MKITNTYNWLRRDFTHDMECEFCRAVVKKVSGYDDDNYYNNVIPSKKCNKCGESSNSMSTYPLPKIKPKHDPSLEL